MEGAAGASCGCTGGTAAINDKRDGVLLFVCCGEKAGGQDVVVFVGCVDGALVHIERACFGKQALNPAVGNEMIWLFVFLHFALALLFSPTPYSPATHLSSVLSPTVPAL